jgi:hypothetical protein
MTLVGGKLVAENPALFQSLSVGDQPAMDPCQPYRRSHPTPGCPLATTAVNATHYITFGAPGLADIVSVATLLDAAGVASLDDVNPASGQTYRYEGLTLIVRFSYTNYYGAPWGAVLSPFDVRYTVTVHAVPGTVKGTTGASTGGGPPLGSAGRTSYAKSGLRIITSSSGKVGLMTAAPLWTAVMNLVGTVAIASIIVDAAARRCLRMSAVYRSYMELVTPDFGELRHPEDVAATVALFAGDKDGSLLHPTPPDLKRIIDRARARGPVEPAEAEAEAPQPRQRTAARARAGRGGGASTDTENPMHSLGREPAAAAGGGGAPDVQEPEEPVRVD